MRKWLRHAHLLAEHSIRDNRYGSVFVIDEKIVSGGCNLVPSQVSEITNCELSATVTAILHAAKEGSPIRGSTLYTTEPSSTASEAKMLIFLGVRSIVRHCPKPRLSGIDEMLEDAGIETRYYEKGIGDYECS